MEGTFEPGATAEDQLRCAKGNIALFNHQLGECERGNEVAFAELRERLERTRRVLISLSEGRVDQPDNGSSGNGSVGSSSLLKMSSVHARVAGRQAVTNFQRRTAQQLLEELSFIDVSLGRYNRKAEQRNVYHSEVDKLLGSLRNQGGYEDLTAIQHAENERTSLQYSRARVRAMLDESSSVMKALQDQGKQLEGTESKLADVLESLGVSNSTILQVLRRNRADAWLVYGGITLTLFFLYLVW
uniref:Putative SNARE protein n=1 Tax=Trypanosoma congolense (strain IL3000) TaxID=1068625 RepID=G0UYS9_TRYCI|nr:putative SNARE protein [Trypanosoma congolense IL3000]